MHRTLSAIAAKHIDPLAVSRLDRCAVKSRSRHDATGTFLLRPETWLLFVYETRVFFAKNYALNLCVICAGCCFNKSIQKMTLVSSHRPKTEIGLRRRTGNFRKKYADTDCTLDSPIALIFWKFIFRTVWSKKQPKRLLKQLTNVPVCVCHVIAWSCDSY